MVQTAATPKDSDSLIYFKKKVVFCLWSIPIATWVLLLTIFYFMDTAPLVTVAQIQTIQQLNLIQFYPDRQGIDSELASPRKILVEAVIKDRYLEEQLFQLQMQSILTDNSAQMKSTVKSDLPIAFNSSHPF